jgi:competence protein ComEC
MAAWMLAWIAGVVAFHQAHAYPPHWLLGLLAAGSSLLLFARLRSAGAFCFGILYAALAAAPILDSRLPHELEGIDFEVLGEVSSIPESAPDRIRFLFTPIGDGGPLAGPVRLTWYHAEQPLRAGQQWRLVVRLKRPHGRLNPGSFDYERYLFTRRLAAVGYVRSGELLGQRTNIAHIRERVAEQVREAVVVEETAGMVVALAMGERQGVSHAQWELFRRTGVSHLMAISGLHVGMVALLCIVIGGRP